MLTKIKIFKTFISKYLLETKTSNSMIPMQIHTLDRVRIVWPKHPCWILRVHLYRWLNRHCNCRHFQAPCVECRAHLLHSPPIPTECHSIENWQMHTENRKEKSQFIKKKKHRSKWMYFVTHRFGWGEKCGFGAIAVCNNGFQSIEFILFGQFLKHISFAWAEVLLCQLKWTGINAGHRYIPSWRKQLWIILIDGMIQINI